MRQGGPADVADVLALFDEAVAWLVARGQKRQWGSEPLSRKPAFRARVDGWARGGGLWLAELGDEPVGALVVGARPAHVAAVEHPELYVDLLLTSRRHAGRDIGGQLVAKAVALGRAAGAELLRVDCWAGAPSLVRWYERQGFVRDGDFELDGWRGQVFSMAL